MALLAAVGQSQDLDGRRAGYQATQIALERLGRAKVTNGWVIYSSIYPPQKLLAGIAELLGEVPIIGFSSSGEMIADGMSKRSVVVLLISGDDIQARAGWWTNSSQDSRDCTHRLLNSLQPIEEQDILFAIADGLSDDAERLCKNSSEADVPLIGCLAGGDIEQGQTGQIGGRQAGSGGLAGVLLSGNIKVGVGAAHGWQPIGAPSRLTSVQGLWVRKIDHQPASETYARLFGYPARMWAFPPLSSMVRQYPLSISDGELKIVRSPLRMEADGSLRMNAHMQENCQVDLMIGSPEKCLEAARQATHQALSALGEARPVAGLALVDSAWQAMLELQPGAEMRAVGEALGKKIPIAGGYTLGQIARLPGLEEVQFLNQHIEVILFAELE